MTIRAPLLTCSLSEVLSIPLRVDLAVLCDLAERLSGLFIMARKVSSLGGVLHDVTMPRSWLINLILPGMDLRKNTSAFVVFAETMIDLVHRIDAQVQRSPTSVFDPGGQFTADGSRITDLTGPLHIARM